jgi:hypothetical protein
MMTMERAEPYRRPHPLGLPHFKGCSFGWFEMKLPSGDLACMMAAPTTDEWQHVSVSLEKRCPTWEEMCMVKDLFWGPEDCVVQFHPPKADYVNVAQHCLHLWCLQGREFPRPPKIFVG